MTFNIQLGKKYTITVKYLGITINEGRSCFNDHKKLKIKKAKELACMIMSVIARSSNKLLIGKTYWKSVVLPDVLYGAEIIPFTKSELNDIQRAENIAFRQILGAPRYAPVCTLRGEIGSSDMESRDQITKLKYLKHLLNSENDLLKEIAQLDISKKTTKFSRITQNYMEQLGINKEQLKVQTDQQTKDAVTCKDTERWTAERNSKSSLEIYNKYKINVKEEDGLYDNSEESVLLFRARTNTLPLFWRNRFKQNATEEDQLCPLCKMNVETLQHFLLRCTKLMHIRIRYNFWDDGDHNKTLETMLCFSGKTQGKSLIKELWSTRKRSIEDTA